MTRITQRHLTSSEPKTTPPTTLAPTSCTNRTPSGSRPSPVASATEHAPAMPTAFPTMSPRSTPSVIGLVTASPSASGERGTPALARGKSGRITKLVHGNRACSVRASGDTASRDSWASRSQCGASASGGSGSSTVRSAVRRASALTACGRWNGSAGASSPSTTPAIVGGIPHREGRSHTTGRDGHPPDGGDPGERGRAPIPELAREELALDLEPHDEEEQRHQAVVHPVAEVLGDRPVTERQPDAGPPDRVVGVAPGRVRPRQRDQGGREEERRARGRRRQELLERPEDAPRDRSIRARPRPADVGGLPGLEAVVHAERSSPTRLPGTP